ncbi:virulence factor BrkB family protein [Vibrio mangrovi]|uniref:UPF0761 membrane protein SBX37_07120 n=1 Tax=Vibrio mangrovi TaxID=474394 RepID=A0A1Y6IYQ2_9VIBR|nr:virulence factor BrkB family protein [Vibrio mangrovi]MDW6002625.1 virulence factor BrkB family protein [Vibrio mangrovi]SMS02784.1 hypothetical protein VIM7927_04126 [Vibrio mangrovi]
MNTQQIMVSVTAFSRYLWRRIIHDRIQVNAGYLAYISLLSFVPMVTVLLSVLSAFSIFDDAGEVIQTFVITHFVPAAGEAVNQALHDFVSNTSKMTAFGGLFLFIVALTLISNIDKTLNYIWRVHQKRRWVFSFSMYWMVLTLGPLLVGASLAVTSYIASLNLVSNETLHGFSQWLLRRLPFLLSFAAFTGLYVLVPNKKVRVRHALSGALIAALLFEISKSGFTAYITHFPSYQVIYGALAAIPILFIWVYFSWLIVLLGAEVTASLGEYDSWHEDMLKSDNSVEKYVEKGKNDDRTDSEGK